ncbi:ABC transporter ATP-binding protein [Alkalicoccus chagannorensis]|uniref:ABC transporter ATP-binding protein n=1 Tax=Alkalicoccus chagannorensis TaxID=427072 RepID=UPI00054F7BBB|nr:ABC transporter ATP-binding protein [Alkalicoccus chagannorensis]
MLDTIQKLWSLFSTRERRHLVMLLFFMIIAAFLETLSIGLIIPLIGIVTNPGIIQEQAALAYLYDAGGFTSTFAFTVAAVGAMLLVFLLKNLYLMLFLYMQQRVILKQQVRLSVRLFRRYLTKPYEFHLQRNTADLLRNVKGETQKVFQGLVMSGFQLMTELLVILFILTLLLVSAPGATLTAAGLLTVGIGSFFLFFRRKVSTLGYEQQVIHGGMIKSVNQGLGASKEIKVSGREAFFIDSYAGRSKEHAKNTLYMNMLEQTPRLFIETFIVSTVLVSMLIILFQETSPEGIIAMMGLFAMAAFRLMPSINRVVNMLNAIRFNRPALEVVHQDMQQLEEWDRPDGESGPAFTKSIDVDQVSYWYPDQDTPALQNISLSIPIGSSTAFVGKSGAGKSTLVDVMLGLYQPDEGTIHVDGIPLFDQLGRWKRRIGYIPQHIYLSDDSIRANVAFGIAEEDIDEEAVWSALKQANVDQFVSELPQSIDTVIGERGVRLSGGQRQRLGIARALYHDPDILFMDEATSALDQETEKHIIEAVDALKGEKTLIIIAHRLSTIENCDLIYELQDGQVIGTRQPAARETS